MTSFNFLETFFFLSLGITFVLILLLVYHFKQRLTNLEQKNESLVELIQMFIKETNMIKINVCHLYDHIHQSSMNFPSQNIAAEFVINGNMNASVPVYAPASECQILDDDNEDEDEDDNEDEDEDDDEDEDEDDDEDEDEDDDDFCGDTNDVDTVYKKIIVEDDVPLDNTLGDIKVINIEETPDEEKQVFDEVEKISSNESVEPSVTNSSQSNDVLEIYKKMNINALKVEVVSKGLCTDTGKLKKADMLKLLEKYHKEQ
jgi:cobalamin biosynthesis protein CobT